MSRDNYFSLGLYFKKETFLLKLGGISLTGNESFSYKVYSYFVIWVVIFPYPFVAFGDLFKHEFDVVAQVCVYFGGCSMAVLMIMVTYLNRTKLRILLNKIEQEPYLPNVNRGGGKEEELINQWISYKDKQFYVFMIGDAFSYLLPVTYTIIKRLTSNPQDWVFGFGPITILNVTHSPNYEIVWMYQNICLFYIALNICPITLTLAGILAFVSVQFKMLQNNFGRIIQNSYKKMIKDNKLHVDLVYTKQDNSYDVSLIPWKYLESSLQTIVRYHLSIIEVATDLEDIFSNTMLSVYLCTVTILCFEVYRAASIPLHDYRILMLLVEIPALSLHSFLICFGGQQMTNESLKVAEAAYAVDFAGSDLKLQRFLIMVIVRSQKPLLIKAGKFIETSIVTFAWIIRTAYSACMVLRRVKA